MKKTIAIIGVDGSGKSTLINQLQNRLGVNAVTKYMGSVRFEDLRIAEFEKKHSLTYKEFFKMQWLIYKCFWNRYRSALRTNKIVLFDRYVNERYINSSGKYKIMALVMYKYLFPRPSHVIYLHCSVETSLKRKDDITDKAVFVAMKKRFDDYYLNDKKCLCLSSDIYSVEELTDIAYNHIMRYWNGKI